MVLAKRNILSHFAIYNFIFYLLTILIVHIIYFLQITPPDDTAVETVFGREIYIEYKKLYVTKTTVHRGAGLDAQVYTLVFKWWKYRPAIYGTNCDSRVISSKICFLSISKCEQTQASLLALSPKAPSPMVPTFLSMTMFLSNRATISTNFIPTSFYLETLQPI